MKEVVISNDCPQVRAQLDHIGLHPVLARSDRTASCTCVQVLLSYYEEQTSDANRIKLL